MRFIVVLTAIGILGAGIMLIRDTTPEQTDMATQALEDTGLSESTQKTNEDTADTSTQNPGEFVAYSPELLASSQSTKNVLFFHASWCPTCRSLERDITANTIPNDVTIFKVDYDSETELRKTYGVTLQHTLVQVDASGQQVSRQVGTSTLNDVIAQLQ